MNSYFYAYFCIRDTDAVVSFVIKSKTIEEAEQVALRFPARFPKRGLVFMNLRAAAFDSEGVLIQWRV